MFPHSQKVVKDIFTATQLLYIFFKILWHLHLFPFVWFVPIVLLHLLCVFTVCKCMKTCMHNESKYGLCVYHVSKWKVNTWKVLLLSSCSLITGLLSLPVRISSLGDLFNVLCFFLHCTHAACFSIHVGLKHNTQIRAEKQHKTDINQGDMQYKMSVHFDRRYRHVAVKSLWNILLRWREWTLLWHPSCLQGAPFLSCRNKPAAISLIKSTTCYTS